MPKDIRSWFPVVNAKKGNTNEEPKNNRKRRVISSDEDEPKKNSPSKKAKVDKKRNRHHTLSDSDEEIISIKKPASLIKSSSKEDNEKKTVSPRDIFGSAPIKRVVAPKVKKEGKWEDDDDCLKQLDTSHIEVEYFSKLEKDQNPKLVNDGIKNEDPDISEISSHASTEKKEANNEKNKNGSKISSSDSKKDSSAQKKSKSSNSSIEDIKFEPANSFKSQDRKKTQIKNAPKRTKGISHIEVEKKRKKSESPKKDKSLDPYEERIEKKKQQVALYQQYLNRGGARNPGSKTIPEGAEYCLAGLSFVITGVLDSLERDEATELIKKYGGRIVQSVSKKTDYIIVGDEPGLSKLNKAKSLGVKQISEDDLLDLIRTRPSGKASEVKETHHRIGKDEKLSSPEPQFQKSSPTKTHVKKDAKEKELETKEEPKISLSEDSGQALVEKYRPTTMNKIIGQQGEKSNAKKLLNWLKNWHKNHSGNVTHKKPSPWSKNDDGAFFKAALLSGPPGVGKTTTVQVVCKELGLDLLEYNASDTRSKRLLKEGVSELLNNTTMKGYFTGENKEKPAARHVLVMDEVDGMAGNEDRGGLQELIALIKSTEVPIICICNDRNHPKMRTLANYTYDLRFHQPNQAQIKGAMLSICYKENINIDKEELDRLITATNRDVRQVINHLALLTENSQTKRESENYKSNKDLKLGPWDVVRKVFSAEEHKNMSIHDKSDLFFHDYNIAGLFVQENYLSVVPQASKSELMDRVAKAAHSLAMGDIIEKKIRQSNVWSLLPVQACFSSVIPGTVMSGRITSQINFPSWLGRNSKSGKFDRLRQEISIHTRLATSASKDAINLDYLTYLRDFIIKPLIDNGIEGVELSVKIMNDYHLMREDLDSIIELSTWPGQRDPMQSVDSKVKAAFTRAYNKSSVLTPYSINSGTIKKKSKTSQDDEYMEDEDEEGAQLSEEDDEDNLDMDKMIKPKKLAASKKAVSTTTNETGSSKRGKGRGKGRGRGK